MSRNAWRSRSKPWFFFGFSEKGPKNPGVLRDEGAAGASVLLQARRRQKQSRERRDAQPVSTRSLANMTAMTWSQLSKRNQFKSIENSWKNIIREP